jgi:hypothetical protein
LKVLLGTGCFRVLRAWWVKDGGRSGGGSSSFHLFTIAFIFFFLGMFVLLPITFFVSNSCINVGLYINIAGQKHLSRKS